MGPHCACAHCESNLKRKKKFLMNPSPLPFPPRPSLSKGHKRFNGEPLFSGETRESKFAGKQRSTFLSSPSRCTSWCWSSSGVCNDRGKKEKTKSSLVHESYHQPYPSSPPQHHHPTPSPFFFEQTKVFCFSSRPTLGNKKKGGRGE